MSGMRPEVREQYNQAWKKNKTTTVDGQSIHNPMPKTYTSEQMSGSNCLYIAAQHGARNYREDSERNKLMLEEEQAKLMVED